MWVVAEDGHAVGAADDVGPAKQIADLRRRVADHDVPERREKLRRLMIHVLANHDRRLEQAALPVPLSCQSYTAAVPRKEGSAPLESRAIGVGADLHDLVRNVARGEPRRLFAYTIDERPRHGRLNQEQIRTEAVAAAVEAALGHGCGERLF